MSAPDFDPARLSVEAFARHSGKLEGRWPLAGFDRLAGLVHAEASAVPQRSVQWQAQGRLRPGPGGQTQPWLALSSRTTLALVSQRCLQPVEVTLDVARSFRFVHGEDAAAQLDAESEEDVLALTRALDLRALIEDELLLALPIVPRHPVCAQPLAASAGSVVEETPPNPFAALATWKRGNP